MTKKRRKQILYDAANSIEHGLNNSSCLAIESAQNYSLLLNWSKLANDYSIFYFNEFQNHVPLEWDFGTFDEEELKHIRIMCLLMFAEAGGDI